MIIKLVGADFSANNIGKVTLKREVSDATKSLLSNYTRSLTTSQQLAVEDFIIGLKSNGLWASIGNLYIPALAGNLNETMFNIKTETKDTKLCYIVSYVVKHLKFSFFTHYILHINRFEYC